jgi:hypothetical protein
LVELACPRHTQDRARVSPAGGNSAPVYSAGNFGVENIRVTRSSMIRLLLIALVLVITGCATNDDNDVIDQAIAARIYRGTTSDTVPYMNIPK